MSMRMHFIGSKMPTVKNQESMQTTHLAEGESESPELGTKRQVRGAAVAGGVTGLVLIGPAAGLLAAGGAALATCGKGEVGKAARVTGDTVSDLGRSLKKFEKKHNIKHKTTTGIVKGCDWVSRRLSKDDGSRRIM